MDNLFPFVKLIITVCQHKKITFLDPSHIYFKKKISHEDLLGR